MRTNPTAEMLREAAAELLLERPDLSIQLASLAATTLLLPQIFGPDHDGASVPRMPSPLALVPPPDGEGTGPKNHLKEVGR